MVTQSYWCEFGELERTATIEIKFVTTIWYINKNLLSSYAFMFETAIVGAQKTSTDECLSVFGMSKNIGNKRNGQKHVSVENKGTRKEISKG